MALTWLLALAVSASAQAPDPALLKELGLSAGEKGWVYRRLRLSDNKECDRLLTGPETAAVLSERVAKLPTAARDEALAKPLRELLEKEGIPPKDFAWFEDGGSRLSALGKGAVVGVWLGVPWGPRSEDCGDKPVDYLEGLPRRLSLDWHGPDPSLARPDFDGKGRPEEATFALPEPPAPPSLYPEPKETPDFHAPKERPPLELSLTWDNAPHSRAYALNLNSLYSLYGRGKDNLIGLVSDDGRREEWGAAARVAGAASDFGLAYLSTLFQHERGHMEYAWLNGSRDVHWVEAPGPYAFGHVVRVDDWERLDARGRQAFVSGGVNATQAALDALRSSFLDKDQIDWTFMPQWLMAKEDFIRYALASPKPSRAAAKDYANDMVNYSNMYAERSGRSPDAVHQDLVRGAVWSALDPLNVWAIYGYAARYVVEGEERIKNPMVKIGDRQYFASTGFHLGETGPKYLLHVLSRDPRDGSMLTVSPSLGDRGQWGLGASYDKTLIDERFSARLAAQVWDHRESADPGPKRLGGSLSFGGGVRLSERVRLGADLGYKTAGDMLGQDFKAGPFFSAGIQAGF